MPASSSNRTNTQNSPIQPACQIRHPTRSAPSRRRRCLCRRRESVRKAMRNRAIQMSTGHAYKIHCKTREYLYTFLIRPKSVPRLFDLASAHKILANRNEAHHAGMIANDHTISADEGLLLLLKTPSFFSLGLSFTARSPERL